jgi:hypothetical protein
MKKGKKIKFFKARRYTILLLFVIFSSLIIPYSSKAYSLWDSGAAAGKKCAIVSDDENSVVTYPGGKLEESKSACEEFGEAQTEATQNGNNPVKAAVTVGGAALKGTFGAVIEALLRAVLAFAGMLLSLAATIFGWMVDTKNFDQLIRNNATIYDVWKNVRDFLNIAFILVLLYSAFCTIFQIESYNYKKILLKLVIMALLVNFSFPITRFVIDISNTLMYTIIGTLLKNDPNSLFGGFAKSTEMQAIINPQNASISFLIAAIVFTFILAITLLAIGVLLIIRLVAFAILLVFSPIAFVGSIISTGEGIAKQWWDNLFKYAFFGPIMLFMLYVAIEMMSKLSKATPQPFANAQSVDSNIIGAMATFSVPIVILWMGMMVAQQMSIFGASEITNKAKGVAQWAGKKFSGYNAAKRQVDAFTGARKKRREEMDKKKLGARLGDKLNDAQDKYIAGGDKNSKAGKRYNKRKDAKNKEDIKEASEKYEGATDSYLNSEIKGMDATAVNAMNDEQKKDAAGKVKQALSRGSAYEKQVEKDIKSATYTPIAGTLPKPRAYVAPKASVMSKLTAGQLAVVNATKKKKEKEIEDWVQSQKEAHMKQARDVIKAAENIDKIP